MFLVRDEWRLVASNLFFKVWGLIKPFATPVALGFFFVVFLSFGFLALFCFCFLQKGILDSKSVVLCKNLI